MYYREHRELGAKGTAEALEKGRDFDLSSTLSNGGVLVFPHAGVHDCGYQISACVHAALDTGADTILVISVLHSFTDEMETARQMVAEGADPSGFETYGIQGNDLPNSRSEWKGDHALISFRHFLAAETRRRGIKPPRLIERYPYLAGGKPAVLPGIDEVARIAENAVVLSTADPFHHGIGYGTPAESALFPNEGGLEAAHASISEGIQLLETADFAGYNAQCVRAKSDARDAGQVYRYICGEMRGSIVDLTYSEAGSLYKTPDPTWVATALIAWNKPTPLRH